MHGEGVKMACYNSRYCTPSLNQLLSPPAQSVQEGGDKCEETTGTEPVEWNGDPLEPGGK